MAPSVASSCLTTPPSCRLGKPSDGNPPPLTQGRLYYGKLLPSALRAAAVSLGSTRAAPLPSHLLRICAGALYFTPSVLPPMFHRTAIHLLARWRVNRIYSLRLIIGIRRMMRHLPEEEAIIGNFADRESACSPLSPQKNTTSFFGDPVGGAYKKEIAFIGNA